MYALPICVAILGIVCIGASFYHWTHSDNPSAFLEAILIVGGLAFLMYVLPATWPNEVPQVEQDENVISEVDSIDEILNVSDNYVVTFQNVKNVVVSEGKVSFEVTTEAELVIVETNETSEVVKATFYLTK